MPRTEEQLRQELHRLQARDEVLRAEVAKYHVNLANAREIDLTFWAPDEASAVRLRGAFERNEMGNLTVMGPGADEANRRWLVRGSVSASVDFITTKENVATFLLFADGYDCEYDGWGTAIVEAAGYRA